MNALGRKESKRLSVYNPEEFKCIIIDEAHHSSADTYQRVLKHMTAMDENSKVKVWGCSATLRRHDGISLKPTFQEIVYHRNVTDMIADKWLCEVKARSVKTSTSLKNVQSTAGDFNLKQLGETVNTNVRNQLVVQSYLEHSGIFFVISVAWA